MNTEFEAHRSEVLRFPEGPFVLVAGRLQSEPELAPKAAAGGRGLTRSPRRQLPTVMAAAICRVASQSAG
jgi:hypothetical protein